MKVNLDFQHIGEFVRCSPSSFYTPPWRFPSHHRFSFNNTSVLECTAGDMGNSFDCRGYSEVAQK